MEADEDRQGAKPHREQQQGECRKGEPLHEGLVPYVRVSCDLASLEVVERSCGFIELGR